MQPRFDFDFASHRKELLNLFLYPPEWESGSLRLPKEAYSLAVLCHYSCSMVQGAGLWLFNQSWHVVLSSSWATEPHLALSLCWPPVILALCAGITSWILHGMQGCGVWCHVTWCHVMLPWSLAGYLNLLFAMHGESHRSGRALAPFKPVFVCHQSPKVARVSRGDLNQHCANGPWQNMPQELSLLKRRSISSLSCRSNPVLTCNSSKAFFPKYI